MKKTTLFFVCVLIITTTYSQTCLNPGFNLNGLRSHKPTKDTIYKWRRKELGFIKIKKHDTIADIGSFDGYYPLIYSIFSDSSVFYLNDITQSGFIYYDSIKTICEQIRGSDFTNKFSIVIGNDSSTKLPDHLFNIVIVREALHHFKMKDRMLADIKRIMKSDKDAKLILYEPIRGQSKREDLCAGAMTKTDLIALLEKNGFVLSKELDDYDRSWFEFVSKDIALTNNK
jgi:ubiquinone/menaquinone biosynthesis C-methylase UbiE